jgi:hypothetical protein
MKPAFLILLLSQLLNSFASAQDTRTDSEIQLTLPPAIYAVPGVETSIFFDNTILSENSAGYQFKVTADIGTSEDRRWVVTPMPRDVGTHLLSLSVHGKDGKLIAEQSTVLRVVSETAGEGKQIKLLIIGDSLTHASVYPNEIARQIKRPGNPRCQMIGTHKPRGAADGVVHEGYGGWTWNRFVTHHEPNPDGNRKHSSPFVFLNDEGQPELDMARYFGSHCNGEQPDYIVIMLGINDCFHAPPDDRAAVEAKIDSMFGYANQLLTAIRKAAPETQIGFCLTTPPNSRQTAFTANYKDRYTRWGWKRIQHRLVQRQLAYVAASADPLISIIPTELNLDPIEGYPPDNGVHPNPVGYQQIGTSIYSWLKWRLASE